MKACTRTVLRHIALILAILILLFFLFEMVFRTSVFRHVLASGFYSQHRYSEAENIWSQDLDPQDGNFIPESSLGNLFYQRSDFPAAQKSYTDAIAEKDSFSRLHYNQGNALYRNDQLDEALQQYKQAMLLDPKDPDAKSNYELVLMRKGYKPPPPPKEGEEDKEEQKPQPQPDKQEQKPEPPPEDKKEQYNNTLDALDQQERPRINNQPPRRDPNNGGNWW